MKKILLFIVLCCFANNKSFSQNINKQSSEESFDEFKLNAFFLVLGAFEVTYEHIFNEDSGLGISLLLPISDEVREDVKYYVSPYYRFYFGEKHAAGFFIEGFGMLNSVKREYFDLDDEFATDFALGVGFGGKWIGKKGFICELNMGLGRNLFKNNKGDSELIGKAGVTLGYRF